MHIAFTYKRIALVSLVLAVAFAACVAAPKAHAQVSDEELAVLQAQVDDAAGQIEGLVARTGKVLGASTDWTTQWDNILKDIMSNGFGKWDGDDEIDKPVKKVEENSKAGLKKQIAKYNAEIERLTKLRDAAEKKLAKLASSTTSTSSKKSFTIDDVKSVTKKAVDPIPQAIDDEYTLYIILLKSGKEVKVKECRLCVDRNTAFKKAGYKGDVDDLRELAEGEKTTTAKSPLFLNVSRDHDTKTVTVTVLARIKADTSAGAPAVDGPVGLGKLDWGDGSEKSAVSGLVGTKMVKLRHTYAKSGTYTLKLTDDYGSVTRKVTLKDE
jgi:hypothetical protein